MENYQYIKVPINLFYMMDANCTKVLITLIQLSDYYPKQDGYFECAYEYLIMATGLSQNVIKATLDALYQEGLIDVKSVGKGKGKCTNRYMVNTDKFKDYENTPLGIAVVTKDKPISTLNYKNHYTPSFSGNQTGKENGKEHVKLGGRPRKKAKAASGKDVISKYAHDNRENPTAAESRFKNFLSNNKISYKFQVPIRCEGKGYIIDFVIHSKSLNKDIAVEIDGGYHNTPDQVQKDKIREDNLKESGYVVVRFKNEETKKDAIYDVMFSKMRHIGASDILNKITVKKYLN